jgi:hypothetical protein
MGLLVKRDSFGYGNLPPMCPTFQPVLRSEWRYDAPSRRDLLITRRFNNKFIGKIARVNA